MVTSIAMSDQESFPLKEFSMFASRKQRWTLAFATCLLSLAAVVSIGKGQGASGSNYNCVAVTLGCPTCASTANSTPPTTCTPGGPAGMSPGTCSNVSGVCNAWASYNCGTAVNCNTGNVTTIQCGFYEYCNNFVPGVPGGD